MQFQKYQNILQYASKYLSKNVLDIEAALDGARDIIAEWINENIGIREKLRRLYKNEAIVGDKFSNTTTLSAGEFSRN